MQYSRPPDLCKQQRVKKQRQSKHEEKCKDTLQSDEEYQTITAKPKSILQTSGKNALKSYHGNNKFKEQIKTNIYLHPNKIIQTNNKNRIVNQLNSISKQNEEKKILNMGIKQRRRGKAEEEPPSNPVLTKT